MTSSRKLLVFFLVFFFVLSPRLDFGIVIHTGLCSAAFLTVLLVVSNRITAILPRQLFSIASLFLIFALYHLVMAHLYGNEASHFVSICISAIISTVFGWLLALYLTDHGLSIEDILDQLLVMLVVAAVANSSIILVEYLLPEVKSTIESYLSQNTEGLIYAQHPFQLRGLASAGGAGISVFNALSIIFIIYLFAAEKISTGVSLMGAFILAVSNIFAGRTGLIIGLIFILFLLLLVLIRYCKSGLFGMARAVGVTILLFGFLSFFYNYNLDPTIEKWAFEWVESIASGKLESASTDDLKTMLFFPDNLIDLLFGVGFFEGIGKIYPRTDSGYLKTLLSIGMPLGLLLYSTIIFMFYRLTKISRQYLWLVISVLVVMSFVEIKEPFFYQNFTGREMFLLSGAAIFALGRRRAPAKAMG